MIRVRDEGHVFAWAASWRAILCSALCLPTLAAAATNANGGECRVRPGTSDFALGTPSELSVKESNLVLHETFDDAADWYSPRGGICARGNRPECADVPERWSYYYSDERWHPDEGFGSAHPSMQVSDEQFRGPSGKSLVVWDESYGSPGDWGSDATLALDLDDEVKDLYAEFHVLFEPGFRWHDVEGSGGTNLAKLFRVLHFDGLPANPFDLFSNGDSAPIYAMDLNIWSFEKDGGVQNRAFLTSVNLCDPQELGFPCVGAEKRNHLGLGGRSFEQSMGDGAWHKIGVRVAMNSSPGTPDGLVEIWVDDEKLARYEGIPFLGGSSPPETGWNMLMIAGNMHNYPESVSARFEQWYAIDDVRLYRLDRP